MSNKFKNSGLLVTTEAQAIYTTPADTETVVHALFLTNITSGFEGLATVIVADSSEGTEYTLLHRAPVSPGSALIFDKPVNLEAGDSLKIKAASDEVISAFLSILEVT